MKRVSTGARVGCRLFKTQAPHFKDTLGWVLYRKGDFKAAIPLLEEAATELPNQQRYATTSGQPSRGGTDPAGVNATFELSSS